MLVNTSLTASVLVTERYSVRYSKYFISITVMKKLKRAGASIEDLKITIRWSYNQFWNILVWLGTRA